MQRGRREVVRTIHAVECGRADQSVRWRRWHSYLRLDSIWIVTMMQVVMVMVVQETCSRLAIVVDRFANMLVGLCFIVIELDSLSGDMHY